MKSYLQFCGVAKALDVLGERWTLLIVRDLILGPRRFTDLARNLSGITPNLLTKRLLLLREQGIVERVASAAPALGRAYQLTQRGRALEGVILGLGAFGAQYLSRPGQGERIDPRSMMLSLKRRYRGTKISGTLVIDVEQVGFTVEIGGSRIEVTDGVVAEPGPRLSGEFDGWFPLMSGRASLSEVLEKGKLELSGSRRLVVAFVRSVGCRV